MSPHSITQAFDERAEAKPSAPALIWDGGIMSYSELMERSTALQAVMVGRGAYKHMDVVDIVGGSCPSWFVAALAVMRSGCRYRTSVSSPSLSPALEVSSTDEPRIVGCAVEGEALGQQKTGVTATDDLACEIRTSGTTGNSKSVLISHANILNLCGPGRPVDLGPGDVMLSVSPSRYSAHLLETWLPLLNGAAVFLTHANSPDLLEMAELIRSRLTIVHLGPALFNALVDHDPESFAGLRCALVGGDRVSAWHVARLREKHPSLSIRACYGATETTTAVLMHEVGVEVGRLPLGKPLQGTSIRLKPYGESADGQTGELCVAGPNIARVVGRAADDLQQGWYATGDVVERQGPHLYPIGRVDEIVNVRGVRTHLGEIRSHVEQLPSVRQAACTVVERVIGDVGSAQLVAVVVPAGGSGIGELRRDWAALNQPIGPDRWVLTESLPLNENGKADARSLRAWLDGLDSASSPAAGAALRRVSDETTAVVFAALADVLTEDDTLELSSVIWEVGLQSVDFLRFAAMIDTQFSTRLDIADLLSCTTVEDVVSLVQAARRTDQNS